MGNDSLANTHPNFLSQSKRKILFDSSKCMKHTFLNLALFQNKMLLISSWLRKRPFQVATTIFFFPKMPAFYKKGFQHKMQNCYHIAL